MTPPPLSAETIVALPSRHAWRMFVWIHAETMCVNRCALLLIACMLDDVYADSRCTHARIRLVRHGHVRDKHTSTRIRTDTPATSLVCPPPPPPASLCRQAKLSQSQTRTDWSALPVAHISPPPRPPAPGRQNSTEVTRSVWPRSAPRETKASGSNRRTSFFVANATSDDAAAAFQSQALLEYQFADGGSSWDIVDETVEV